MKHGEMRFETLGRSTSRVSRAISCTNTEESESVPAKEGYTSDHRNDLESRERIFINPSTAEHSTFKTPRLRKRLALRMFSRVLYRSMSTCNQVIIIIFLMFLFI